jgi:long-chain acyl-CoA synthetase
MIGTVGPPVTTIEARLESVPEMGYDALSGMPRGEICLRGHTLFSGYYKRPDLTEEVFSDDWFHTGAVLLTPIFFLNDLLRKTISLSKNF